VYLAELSFLVLSFDGKDLNFLRKNRCQCAASIPVPKWPPLIPSCERAFSPLHGSILDPFGPPYLRDLCSAFAEDFTNSNTTHGLSHFFSQILLRITSHSITHCFHYPTTVNLQHYLYLYQASASTLSVSESYPSTRLPGLQSDTQTS
jgi:hypothetical protein